MSENTCAAVVSQETVSAFNLFEIVVELVLMVLIVVGNGLIIVVFLRNQSLRTRSNFFVFMLAIADFLMGAATPYHVALFFDASIRQNPYACAVRFAIMTLSGSASVLALTTLTHDRYIAITRPLLYTDTIPRARVVLTTCKIWLPSLIVNFLCPLFWMNADFRLCPECNFITVTSPSYHRYVMIPSSLLTFLVLILFYARMFTIAHRQIAKIAAADTSMAPPGGTTSFRQQTKLLKTGFIVCASFYLCWLPYFAMLTLELFVPGMYNVTSHKSVRAGLSLLAIANSALNVVIYTLRLPAFRRAILRLLGLRDPTVGPKPDRAGISRTAGISQTSVTHVVDTPRDVLVTVG